MAILRWVIMLMNSLPLKRYVDVIAFRAADCRSNYNKCRQDGDFDEWMYVTVLLSAAAFVLVAVVGAVYVAIAGISFDLTVAAAIAIASAGATLLAYYARAYSVRSMKDFRGALIDASLVHAIGFMLTMAESNVPLRKMFENISNLGSVYGEDIALEATYILSLVEEDGMDVVSALRKAQSTSPSALWQELLIGIAGSIWQRRQP